ncbi:hypothetical protein HK405_005707, partial [Cladochytrium tenue]
MTPFHPRRPPGGVGGGGGGEGAAGRHRLGESSSRANGSRRDLGDFFRKRRTVLPPRSDVCAQPSDPVAAADAAPLPQVWPRPSLHDFALLPLPSQPVATASVAVGKRDGVEVDYDMDNNDDDVDDDDSDLDEEQSEPARSGGAEPLEVAAAQAAAAATATLSPLVDDLVNEVRSGGGIPLLDRARWMMLAQSRADMGAEAAAACWNWTSDPSGPTQALKTRDDEDYVDGDAKDWVADARLPALEFVLLLWLQMAFTGLADRGAPSPASTTQTHDRRIPAALLRGRAAVDILLCSRPAALEWLALLARLDGDTPAGGGAAAADGHSRPVCWLGSRAVGRALDLLFEAGWHSSDTNTVSRHQHSLHPGVDQAVAAWVAAAVAASAPASADCAPGQVRRPLAAPQPSPQPLRCVSAAALFHIMDDERRRLGLLPDPGDHRHGGRGHCNVNEGRDYGTRGRTFDDNDDGGDDGDRDDDDDSYSDGDSSICSSRDEHYHVEDDDNRADSESGEPGRWRVSVDVLAAWLEAVAAPTPAVFDLIKMSKAGSACGTKSLGDARFGSGDVEGSVDGGWERPLLLSRRHKQAIVLDRAIMAGRDLYIHRCCDSVVYIPGRPRRLLVCGAARLGAAPATRVVCGPIAGNVAVRDCDAGIYLAVACAALAVTGPPPPPPCALADARPCHQLQIAALCPPILVASHLRRPPSAFSATAVAAVTAGPCDAWFSSIRHDLSAARLSRLATRHVEHTWSSPLLVFPPELRPAATTTLTPRDRDSLRAALWHLQPACKYWPAAVGVVPIAAGAPRTHRDRKGLSDSEKEGVDGEGNFYGGTDAFPPVPPEFLSLARRRREFVTAFLDAVAAVAAAADRGLGADAVCDSGVGSRGEGQRRRRRRSGPESDSSSSSTSGSFSCGSSTKSDGSESGDSDEEGDNGDGDNDEHCGDEDNS